MNESCGVVVSIRQMEMESLAMVTTTSFWHGDMILLWGSKCGSKAGCGQGNGTAVVGGGVMPSAQTDRIRGPGVRKDLSLEPGALWAPWISKTLKSI